MSTEIALPPKFRTVEEWGAGLSWLLNFKRNWQWLFGTYLLRGEERFHDKIWQYVHFDEIPYDRGYLDNIMSVCRRIGDQYTPEIKEWTFWEAMAPMTPKQRDPIITRALAGDIDRDEIRALRAAGRDLNGAGAKKPKNGSTGTADAASGLPDARGAALQAYVDALTATGKLAVRFGRGEPINGLLRDSGDALLAAWLKLAPLLE